MGAAPVAERSTLKGRGQPNLSFLNSPACPYATTLRSRLRSLESLSRYKTAGEKVNVFDVVFNFGGVFCGLFTAALRWSVAIAISVTFLKRKKGDLGHRLPLIVSAISVISSAVRFSA